MAFGKRVSAVSDAAPSQSNETVSKVQSTVQTGSIAGRVLVRQSAYDKAKSGEDDYALVGAVVDFVNAMTGPGYYRRDEFPQKAMQVYHADYYLAQVNNGGHSQFIHNTGGNAPFTFADARAGLGAMGAPHLAHLQAMIDWIAANPQEASRQNGFDNRAVYLDELDKAFYKTEDEQPMIGLSTRWILSWPELAPVADDKIGQCFAELVKMNPQLSARMDHRRFAVFVDRVHNSFHAASSFAAAACAPREALTGIGAGSAELIDGEQVMCMRVTTTEGDRRLAILSDAVALYEYVDPDRERRRNELQGLSLEDSWKRWQEADYETGRLGRKLSQVSNTSVEEFLVVAGRHNAAAAMWLLFRKFGMATDDPWITPIQVRREPGAETGIIWLVLANGHAFRVLNFEEGSALLPLDGQQPLARVTREEVDAAVAALGDR